MFAVRAVSRAHPDLVWPLIAEPARWSAWAPHIRGAVGLGSPEVEAGRRGVVLVAFLLPVPVAITAKMPGRSWEWTTGPVRFRHVVAPHPEGSEVSMELEAPALVEAALARSYGPIMAAVSRRLARVAAAD